MNELFFLCHILIVITFGFVALRMGLAALSTWVVLQAILANLFVIKQIPLFGFHVTCSDVFAIGSMLGLNLIREYFGKQASEKTLWSCFFFMFFFVVMAKMHLLYQPSPFDTAHLAYEKILAPTPRLLTASLIVFLAVQRLDLTLFGYLKNKYPYLSLSIRSGISLTISQFLDTLFFSILGLWGLVSNLFDIVVISFLLKLIILFLTTPLIHFSRRFKREISI